MCIDPHQTGFVGKGSDHLQLIIFWPSRTPRKGICDGAKIFGSTLLQPECSVCVSLSAFFILFVWINTIKKFGMVTRFILVAVNNQFLEKSGTSWYWLSWNKHHRMSLCVVSCSCLWKLCWLILNCHKWLWLVRYTLNKDGMDYAMLGYHRQFCFGLMSIINAPTMISQIGFLKGPANC